MEVDKLLAFCGLKCDGCQIYLASMETDREKQAEMRVQIAELVSEEYGMNIKPKDVTDCDGCRANGGRLYSGCSKCEIRKCAQEKGCMTCAHCIEYPCDKLQKFFVTDPTAKSHLEDIRSSIKNDAARFLR
jgi:hypothetical protein